MHARHITGINGVVLKSDSRKASSHAGSTGLTGLTGSAGAHMCEACEGTVRQGVSFLSLIRANKNMLTLLTLFKASSHAGFSVTGFRSTAVMACKGA
jgi:hypothetical protein